MDFETIKKSLSQEIERQLLPLITGDYVLWGLPNYRNEGDVLIWQGTHDFLKTVPHRCVGSLFYDEYHYRPMSKETIILVLGGGYFGDTWRKAWEYVVKTVSQYPDNPIVFLPQSIHYQSNELLAYDIEALAKCRHLTICARDEDSFIFSRKHFGIHHTCLVPDLAFYIKRLKWGKTQGKGILFIKREDKELAAPLEQSPIINADLVSDWPSIKGYRSLDFCLYVYSRLRRFWSRPFFHWLSLLWMDRVYRPLMISRAVRFIEPYNEVYATRLHAMILSLMMNKKVHYLDNVYGKLSALHHTWLPDCDNLDQLA